MKVLVVTGSRADYGMLEWPIKALRADPFFSVDVLKFWGYSVDAAHVMMTDFCTQHRPDLVLLLGDRYEILAAATAAHLLRVPIAHIGGGDVTQGSYDDAMRDCISRMASVHFVTSTSAMARLCHMAIPNAHLVGSPGIDYIRHADWKRERPIAEPYVVVSYQAETIDGYFGVNDALAAIGTRKAVFILPNPDLGSDDIRTAISAYANVDKEPDAEVYDFLPHAQFLNLIFHCDEFIGNSSAMLYEAPELKIKTRMIGKRQRGRTIPFGDGGASERIVRVLKYGAL